MIFNENDRKYAILDNIRWKDNLQWKLYSRLFLDKCKFLHESETILSTENNKQKVILNKCKMFK